MSTFLRGLMHVLLIGGVANQNPGSVMDKKSGSLSVIRIWDEPVSYFREIKKKTIFCAKILKFFDPGSGME